MRTRRILCARRHRTLALSRNSRTLRLGCFPRGGRARGLVQRAVPDGGEFLLDGFVRFRVGGGLVSSADGSSFSSRGAGSGVGRGRVSCWGRGADDVG